MVDHIKNNDSQKAVRESSRSRLLSTAGEAFAEKGFDRATAREICITAGVNPAAVNYYFGTKDGLYEAVLQEAHRRILDIETQAGAIPEAASPEVKLESFLRLIIPRLFATPRDSWHLRVIAREMANPTPAFNNLVENEILPKSIILRTIIAEYLECPLESAVVSHCSISVVSQFLAMFQNLTAFCTILPDFGNTPSFVATVCDHIVQFCIGGMDRIRQKQL